MTKRFYDGLDEDIRTILLAQIRNLWTHTSTAIEGNTLSLGDTAFVLEQGLTVSGKPLKDHQEIYGHSKAIELIYRLLGCDKLDKTDLFDLHKAVLTDAITDIYKPVGAWKKESNFTSFVTPDGKQSWREYPIAALTDRLMSQWLSRIDELWNQDLSRDRATRAYADAHLSFVTIHPFYDGNGRMARLLANLPVLAAGFPPLIIPVSDRKSYLSAISDYQNTITGLASLNDLDKLPDNPEKRRFIGLCSGYWSETMELLDKAKEIQSTRIEHRQYDRLIDDENYPGP
jgi:Fic family protein